MSAQFSPTRDFELLHLLKNVTGLHEPAPILGRSHRNIGHVRHFGDIVILFEF